MFPDWGKNKGQARPPRRPKVPPAPPDLHDRVEEAARRVESRQRRELTSAIARRHMIRDLDKT